MSALTIIEQQSPRRFVPDFDLLQAFESNLDPTRPEQNVLPSRVLGYGEISTVFAIDVAGLEGLALKRMVLFETAAELSRYLVTYHTYNQLLTEKIGLTLPDHGHIAFQTASGRPVFYIIQQQLPAGTIGSQILHSLAQPAALQLFERLLARFGQLWQFNQSQPETAVGLDGQISNWALPVSGGELLYIDTSTPLVRLSGQEQLNVELFLRSAPSFLRWILRRFFLADVVDRYYDVRLVVIDLIANLYKEKLELLIPSFIAAANDYFAGELAAARIEPIEAREVRAYYREDAFIWSLYGGMRRLDRQIYRHVLRRPYIHILPGKTRR
ncbi:MAG: hypothetical protein KDE28_09500 [Anaerolineales bacterium]|nr:hypothetical protein [Anaerolineales bacterium]MCB8961367.1 hypothetical protein [Ardenticatenales bacterium]